jgi:hypothetical protein
MMTCGSNNACELLHTLKKIFAGCFGNLHRAACGISSRPAQSGGSDAGAP